MGVFQLRKFVVGPFGILNSSCLRYLSPIRRLPLRHCPDPSCSAMHRVILSEGKNRLRATHALISAKFQQGASPEWHNFFLELSGLKDTYYDDMNTAKFPWMLINSFSKVELRMILKTLIEHYSTEIRENFPVSKRFRNLFSASAEKIAKELSKSECFQLILLLSDENIIGSLEWAVEKAVINIPYTEVREAPIEALGFRHSDPYGGFLISHQCSKFGVRASSVYKDLGVLRLKQLIKSLYDETDKLSQLAWYLRHERGESILMKLDRYVRHENPGRIIKELVLNDPAHLSRTFERLKFGRFPIPTSSAEEEYTIDKILWKLGFNITLYPPHQRLFWSRLGGFLEAARTDTEYTENDKELIRGSAVNFSVSLEEILDLSLSFATWMLLSDHYISTKFKFNIEEARRFMALKLNEQESESEEPRVFDAEGKNTLFPLIKGFHILSEICRSMMENKGAFNRPESQIPRYHRRTNIQLFPFMHTAFILDIRKEDADRIVGLLSEISMQFEKFQIASIRNRIEHKRKDFPRQSEIEKACEMMSNIAAKMESSGLCPLVYFFSGKTCDEYYRDSIKVKDYKGRQVDIYRPSQFDLLHLPSFGVPLIVVPCIHIGETCEMLRFQYEENSDYIEMWRNYPKKRLPIREID